MLAGIPTYVEEAGSGQTLFYLHGATEWIGCNAVFVEMLASRFHVIQAERRGHGRTPDVAGTLTYAAMAADTVALMEQFERGPSHLVGFSDGGIIALLVAIARPDLVERVVAIGSNARVDGLTDEMLAWLGEVTPETWPPEFVSAYSRLSPDGPDHWPVVCRKLVEMALREPDLSADQLATIRAPTLLVAGDRDIVRLDHLAEMHRAITGSQLCIVRDAGHNLPREKPRRLFSVTARFLNAPRSAVAVGQPPR